MPNDPRHIVESGYDAIADRYAEAIRAGRGPETYFRGFLARVLEPIPEGGTVLDLGCGAGLVTADLTTRARVVGVDISAGQLELARRNAPAARFVRADMVDPAFAPASFDAVVAFWTLIHVPREVHASLLARIHGWLKPGALFAGTLGSGDNPAEHVPDFYGAPMYWSHFDGDTNRGLLRGAGFDILQADEIEDEGETPLWVIARA
ncbi:MAG TPA: class I SAM-dependent methyltransferase [Actinomycetota bacterium]|nr:class I SAM-dependent methyltransferase [Actinomycetota bacterium]